MDRHQSVPNTSNQTSNLENLETKLNAIRLELDKSDHALPTSVTHSLSAPSDFGCWEERYHFHGESDDEKDGPSSKTISLIIYCIAYIRIMYDVIMMSCFIVLSFRWTELNVNACS